MIKNFKFHSNLTLPNKTIISWPSYYKDIIDSSCEYYSCLRGSMFSFFAIFMVQFIYQNW